MGVFLLVFSMNFESIVARLAIKNWDFSCFDFHEKEMLKTTKC